MMVHLQDAALACGAVVRGPTRAPNGWMPGQYSQPPPRATRRPEWQAPLGRGEQTQYLTTTNGIAKGPIDGRRSPNKADQILGRERGMYADGDVQLQTIDRKKFDQYNYISEDEDDDYEVSSDEQAVDQRKAQKVQTVTAPPKGTPCYATPECTYQHTNMPSYPLRPNVSCPPVIPFPVFPLL